MSRIVDIIFDLGQFLNEWVLKAPKHWYAKRGGGGIEVHPPATTIAISLSILIQ